MLAFSPSPMEPYCVVCANVAATWLTSTAVVICILFVFTMVIKSSYIQQILIPVPSVYTYYTITAEMKLVESSVCGRTPHNLFVRDDISEMEAAAKHFEEHQFSEDILPDIVDGCESSLVPYLSKGTDGYFPYCEINLDSKPEIAASSTPQMHDLDHANERTRSCRGNEESRKQLQRAPLNRSYLGSTMDKSQDSNVSSISPSF